jgi:hypothetical protein
MVWLCELADFSVPDTALVHSHLHLDVLSLAGVAIEITVMWLFLLCLVFGPLLVFTPQLAQAKRNGLREYGTFAESYVREFDAKWLRGRAPAEEPLLGSDIQSLADLGNSFTVIRSMRLAPVTRTAVLQLTAAVLVPIAPLLLTTMPLEALLQKLFGLVF